MYTIEQKHNEKKQADNEVADYVERTRREIVEKLGEDCVAIDHYDYADEAERARDYARQLAQGSSKVEAFLDVLRIDVDVRKLTDVFKKWLSNRHWRYEHLKAVVRELDYVSLKTHILFSDKHLRALEEQFTLGMTARSEKVRADALHQFIQNTRNPNIGKPTDDDIQLVNANRQLLDSITNAFNAVRGNPHQQLSQVENTPNRIFSTLPNLQKDSV